MSTQVRSKLSTKNKYYLPEYRFLELKYFCLQYPAWVKERDKLLTESLQGVKYEKKDYQTFQNECSITEELAIKRLELEKKIKMVEEAVQSTDKEFAKFLLIGVTLGKTYPYLSTKLNMPLSRSSYYERYRRFFFELSKVRE